MKTTAIATDAMELLLTKAIGGRSMTQFAKSCGISPMHVSRIKSGICTPSKKMCLKFSSDSYVKSIGLTSRDFLEAAGYKDENEVESICTFEQVVSKQMNTVAFGIISQRLMDRKATYQIKSSGQSLDCDYEVQIRDGRVENWNIVLDVENHVSDENAKRLSYFYYLGRLMSFKPETGRQYSMIINDDEIYDQIIDNINKNMIEANVSVALLDAKQMEIRKENHFGEGEFISLLAKTI